MVATLAATEVIGGAAHRTIRHGLFFQMFARVCSLKYMLNTPCGYNVVLTRRQLAPIHSFRARMRAIVALSTGSFLQRRQNIFDRLARHCAGRAAIPDPWHLSGDDGSRAQGVEGTTPAYVAGEHAAYQCLFTIRLSQSAVQDGSIALRRAGHDEYTSWSTPWYGSWIKLKFALKLWIREQCWWILRCGGSRCSMSLRTLSIGSLSIVDILDGQNEVPSAGHAIIAAGLSSLTW